MNPISMLKEDHKKVLGLLDELAATTTRAIKTRADLVKKICQEMEVHTALEEGLFYPTFRKAAQGKEDKMYFEALEEHRAVEELVLPDLLNTDPASEKFSGRAKVLRELIEHHIKEEERDMFPRMRDLLSAQELQELARMMSLKKQTLLALERGEPLEAARQTGKRVMAEVMSVARHATEDRRRSPETRRHTTAD